RCLYRFFSMPPSPAAPFTLSLHDALPIYTEGNLADQYGVTSVKSAFGSTIDFSLAYNSYNADGSRAQLDTVMGFGWTHSYNIFLDRKSTRLNSSHDQISYAVFCLKKKTHV